MPLSTCPVSWPDFLEQLLPRVDVLLNAIVLWVAFRTRSTLSDEQQTLSRLVVSGQRSDGSQEPRESRRRVQDRRK